MGAFGCRARGVRRLREGGEAEYMGMVVATEELSRGSPRHRRLADHPARDPHPCPREGRHRGAEAALAAEAGHRRGDGAVAVTEPDFGSDVAGIKVTATPARARRRGRLGDQRRQDVVHVRRPRRRAHAAGPHRPRPDRRPTAGCRCSSCPSRAARATASSSPRRTPTAAGRQDGGPAHRHHRLPWHALLRGRVRGLVGAGREPRSAARRGSARASTTRWRGSRTAGCRPRRAPSA